MNKINASQQFPPELIGLFEKIEQRRLAEIAELKRYGIFVNYVKPVNYKGGRVWALGSTVYHSRPPSETFHEFIIFVLQLTLGQSWFEAESKKVEVEQHYIYKAFVKFNEWRRANSTKENASGHGWAARPDGWTQSLISLAFDVASLQHANRLPEDLLERLRGYDSYQGARYEIGVAAIFVRLGFDIEFIDPRRGPKRCEFIARHGQTGMEIAIEAKSRHRQGVIHTRGTTSEFKLAKGDVGKLYHEALQKTEIGKMPCMIFIDVNCPITAETDTLDKKWGKDIKRLTSRTKISKENPDPCNTIAFTNFSTHYDQSRPLTRNGEFVMVVPMFTKFTLKDPSLLDGVYNALNHYGSVPNIQPREDDID